MKRSLLAATLVAAGCAGQLELPPQAYQANAQTSGEAGTSDGGLAPSSIGTTGAGAPAPKPEVSDAAPWGPADGGLPPTGAGTTAAKPDAAWAADAPAGGGSGGTATPAADAAAPTPVASVCPPGVDALGLLGKRCGSCHGDRQPAKGLDLVTPGLAGRLVGIKSTCPNRALLDAAPVGTMPEPTGHFLDKLNGPVSGCGAQMPYGTPALSPSEYDCIVEWAAKAVARGMK
jgi:hypothetical protein